MPISALALVLTAAVCHATWNYFVKRINGGPELLWLFSAVASLVYMPLVIWIVAVERPVLEAEHYLFMLGSALLHLAYFTLLQMGYRKGDLSLVYPTARATGPMLSAIFAVLVLGEAMTTQMMAGAGIIIFGVMFLTAGRGGEAGRPLVSLGFGVLVGCFIAGYTVWDAYAVSTLLIPPLLYDYATTVGRVAFLSPVASRRWDNVRALWRDHRPGVFVIAILSPLAYILVLYALTYTPVTYVAPTRELSVLLTVLAGSFLLKEGHLRWRLGWAVVILVGMVLLVTG